MTSRDIVWVPSQASKNKPCGSDVTSGANFDVTMDLSDVTQASSDHQVKKQTAKPLPTEPPQKPVSSEQEKPCPVEASKKAVSIEPCTVEPPKKPVLSKQTKPGMMQPPKKPVVPAKPVIESNQTFKFAKPSSHFQSNAVGTLEPPKKPVLSEKNKPGMVKPPKKPVVESNYFNMAAPSPHFQSNSLGTREESRISEAFTFKPPTLQSPKTETTNQQIQPATLEQDTDVDREMALVAEAMDNNIKEKKVEATKAQTDGMDNSPADTKPSEPIVESETAQQRAPFAPARKMAELMKRNNHRETPAGGVQVNVMQMLDSIKRKDLMQQQQQQAAKLPRQPVDSRDEQVNMFDGKLDVTSAPPLTPR